VALAAAWATVAASAWAQQSPRPQGTNAVQDRWPSDPSPTGQASQENPASAAPKRAAPVKPAPTRTAAAAAGHAVACSGVFAKDSNHVKLTTAFKSNNVTFTEVDAPDGSKLPASVLYSSNPKQRLEVLWQDEASRAEVSVISINGQSTWEGPRGLRLGMPLASLEKANGKAFKLGGFGENGSSVVDWNGGALDQVPGGCKIGVRLVMDATTPEPAREAVGGEKELFSTDPPVRAVKPKIAEILIGY
jgi:hypothetical protein